MKVIITGATGFIGRALCGQLYKDYEIIALTRSAEKASKILGQEVTAVEWNGKTSGQWAEEIDGADIVINLAGENIASGKWNQRKKNRILQSRIDSLKALTGAIRKAGNKPRIFMQASAIGYYGSQKDNELNESSPPGRGFLASVCRVVESATLDIERLGVRCVIIRTGIVLGNQGGALPKLALPFRFFIGGYPGDGKQWFSWINLEDEVRAIKFLIENENQQGVFNLTSPGSMTMKNFCQTLGTVLHRPCWFVPDFILRIFLGEKADQVLLSGQKVIPKRLLEAGFRFNQPKAENALVNIFKSGS
ncbi:TIGR01777 family oxidoreductase [Planctomycetota bacterium]